MAGFDFATARMSEAQVGAVMRVLNLPYRLVLDSAGQFALYVQISSDDVAEHWNTQFGETYERLRDNNQLPAGVLRSFDPDGVSFLPPEEIDDDLYLARLFNNQQPIVVHMPAPHLQHWIQPEQITSAKPGRAKRIVFYSYKGGVGRTTALILSALLLANRGKKVVLVDFDLEAPGLSATVLKKNEMPEKGIVDYLVELPALRAMEPTQRIQELQEHFLTEMEMSFDHPEGRIAVFTAGNVDITYPEKLAYASLEDIERTGTGQNPLDTLFADIEEALPGTEFVLIDSRTGIADIGGSLLFKYADAICAAFYGNTQNQEGMSLLVHYLLNRDDAQRPPVIWVHALARLLRQEQDPHQEMKRHLWSAYQKHDPNATEPEILAIDFHDNLRRINRTILEEERPQAERDILVDYERLVEAVLGLWPNA